MTRLGRYEIVGTLGGGGMGSVFRATDTVLERDVALKTIFTGADLDAESLERFYREARSCARLQHPHIVTLYDMGEQDGIVYIVMELLTGADLRSIITEKRPLPLETKIELMAQVAEGLAHAHSHSIIHRDIKPANIFVQHDNRAKILDFGIARVASSRLTRVGAALGTPDYMAPEQIAGQVCDARSDLFSAAIVFWEFLAHAHPFGRSNIAQQIARQDPASLRAANPLVPECVEVVLARGLEKNPRRRYQSGDEFAAALRALNEEIRKQSPQEEAPVVSGHNEAFVAAAARGPENGPPLPDSLVKALRRRARQLLESDRAACVAFLEGLGPRQQADREIARILEEARASVGPPAPQPASSPDSAIRLAAAASSTAAQVAEVPAPPRSSDLPPRRLILQPLATATSLGLPRPKPPRLQPLHKWILGSVALGVLLVAAVIVLFGRRTPLRYPHAAFAEVSSSRIQILAEPDPKARVVASLERGARVNVLSLPPSRSEEWIWVQYVEGSKSLPAGYVRMSELVNWSSDNPESALRLIQMFAPGETATEAELEAQLKKWIAFTDRFAITLQGPEGNLERALIHLSLARLHFQAGRPPSRWQPHLDSAAGQLAMASATPGLATQVAQARQALQSLTAQTSRWPTRPAGAGATRPRTRPRGRSFAHSPLDFRR